MTPDKTPTRFKKKQLVRELLGFKTPNLTSQIANLIGDEIAHEIRKKRLERVTSSWISETVALKMAELGFFSPRTNSSAAAEPPARDSLSLDILKILVGPEKKQQLTVAGIHANKQTANLPAAVATKFCEEASLRDPENKILETAPQILDRSAHLAAEAEKHYNPAASLKKIGEEFRALMSQNLFFPDMSLLRETGNSLETTLASAHLSTPENSGDILKLAADIGKLTEKNLQPTLLLKEIAGLKNKKISPAEFVSWLLQTTRLLSGKNPSLHGIISFHQADVAALLKEEKIRTTLLLDEKAMELLEEETHHDRNFSKDSRWRDILLQAGTGKAPSLLWPQTARIPENGLTNPEGSLFFQPHERVFGGFLNLSAFVEKGVVQWTALAETIHKAVHFLDNLIEASPVKGSSRKLALSPMGWADFLEKLFISYGSDQSFEVAEKLMGWITTECLKASRKLGQNRGGGNRHATLTAVLRSDTLAEMASCTPGIEPDTAKTKPEFLTPSVQLQMQAAFQKSSHHGVSKILFTEHSTENEAATLILQAYRLEMKNLNLQKGSFPEGEKRPGDAFAAFSESGSNYFVPPEEEG